MLEIWGAIGIDSARTQAKKEAPILPRSIKGRVGKSVIDFSHTLEKCIRIDNTNAKWTLARRFVRAVLKVFAPML